MSSNELLANELSSTRFHQARLKHIWANHHIDQLHGQWKDFIKSDFCRIAVNPKPNGRGESLGIEALKPLPAEFVLTLGDAIHNLRCSLDYTIAELLGFKDTRLTFPMDEGRQELIDSFRTEPEIRNGKTVKKGRNAAIEVAAPGIGRFIADTIKPYKAGDGLIWHLGKLDARDKHRLLIPVVVPKTISGIDAIDDNGNVMIGCTVSYEGTGFSGGFGLASNVKIKKYGKPTAEIFINEIGILERKRLFPTLINISQSVAQTINSIDEFLITTGWTPATHA